MKNNVILRYILLKIQSGEWKDNDKIPSERALMIKFGVSKSYVVNSLKTLQRSNVIYSKPSIGNFILPNSKSIYFSKTMSYENCDIEITKIKKQLFTKVDKDTLKLAGLDPNTKNYNCIMKKYIIDEKIVNLSFFFLTKDIIVETEADTNLLKESLYKFLAYNNKIIIQKETIIIDSEKTSKNLYKYPENSYLEILYDWDNGIPCVIKTFDFKNKSNIYRIFKNKIF